MRFFNSACAVPMAVAIALSVTALIGCAQRDDSDPPDGRSGLLIYTDHLTGCQYVARLGLNGAAEPLTPRMRADGSQVCEQNRQAR